jgi:dihydroceramide fatty acyl 2-hydroxylase
MPSRLYWIDFVVYPIATLAITALTLRHWSWPAWFAGGAFMFGFAEYYIHRFFLHLVFEDRHKLHHALPRRYIVTPWYLSFLITGALALIVPWGMICGVMAAYSFYCYVHHWAHHPLSPRSRHGKLITYLCNNHYEHHLKNNVNYGVTSPMFDVVFSTYQPHRS